ncbi:hypothetical protein VMT65_09120 [Nocardia sp. CDC153]|uniref:hypothetical protein n=1 Tax=Nocardia sp. CDC153 TaxID=3112167 RepID=UPI002DB7AE5F|nr:hypothetical protein [Nocardia sp. CDC153]MEC3953186.1 hypothetical protein [Nocardia sp. CDC153]
MNIAERTGIAAAAVAVTFATAFTTATGHADPPGGWPTWPFGTFLRNIATGQCLTDNDGAVDMEPCAWDSSHIVTVQSWTGVVPGVGGWAGLFRLRSGLGNCLARTSSGALISEPCTETNDNLDNHIWQHGPGDDQVQAWYNTGQQLGVKAGTIVMAHADQFPDPRATEWDFG